MALVNLSAKTIEAPIFYAAMKVSGCCASTLKLNTSVNSVRLYWLLIATAKCAQSIRALLIYSD